LRFPFFHFPLQNFALGSRDAAQRSDRGDDAGWARLDAAQRQAVFRGVPEGGAAEGRILGAVDVYGK
jgi:hypothetical protein